MELRGESSTTVPSKIVDRALLMRIASYYYRLLENYIRQKYILVVETNSLSYFSNYFFPSINTFKRLIIFPSQMAVFVNVCVPARSD